MEISYLWKKEKNGNSERYIKLFEIHEKTDPNIGQIPTGKNNSLSNEHIRAAKFKLNESHKSPESLLSAMENCNAALRYAEIGSENVSIAYAYRSECFFNLYVHDKCLVDIELATNVGCPRNLPKLSEQRHVCNQILKGYGKYKRTEPKLSFKPNKHFPSFANVLDIQKNNEFGRHVVAKSDIPVGKTVVVEKNFASITKFSIYKGCATCHEIHMNFIACNKCATVVFCDAQCKEQNLTHKYECGVLVDYPKASKMIIQTILIGLSSFSTVDQLIDFVEGVISQDPYGLPSPIRDQQSKYKFFLILYTYLENDFIPQRFINLANQAFQTLIKLPSI